MKQTLGTHESFYLIIVQWTDLFVCIFNISVLIFYLLRLL